MGNEMQGMQRSGGKKPIIPKARNAGLAFVRPNPVCRKGINGVGGLWRAGKEEEPEC